MQKEKTNGMIEIKFIIFLAVIALLLIAVLFYPYYKPRKVIWCYYKQNVTNSPIPRSECVYMKIISKDVKEINLEQFYNLNISDAGCFDSYDVLPLCSGDDFYFAQFDLSRFAQKEIDGNLCVAYYITFYDSNYTNTDYYKDIYEMTYSKVKTVGNDLKEKMINCRVR